MWEWEGTSSGVERDTRFTQVSGIHCKSNYNGRVMLIFLRWGTVHWQYVSRGLVSYYLVVYTYVRAYVKYFYAGEQSTVSYVSRGPAQCIYILLLFCYFVTADSVVVHFSP